MSFRISDDIAAALEVGRLLNAGLFYSLVVKASGVPVGHYYTHLDAKRAKTRKTRVILTRNLLKTKANHHEQNKSIRS